MIQNLKVKHLFVIYFNNSNKMSHTNITLNIFINNCDSCLVLCHKRIVDKLLFSIFKNIGKLNRKIHKYI